MRRASIVFSGLLAGAIMTSGLSSAAWADQPAPGAKPEQLTPEQKMASRWPQPVVVSALLGAPMLDLEDRTVGYVGRVVQTPQGKIQLIMQYGKWFGWVPDGGPVDRWRRPVAVPLEAVAIVGKHINILDVDRETFPGAATWSPDGAVDLAAQTTIRIAIARR